MLRLENLSYDYGYVPVFSPINVEVLAGNLLHIKGKNGCGKTTLLKLCALLIEPTTGSILFKNAPAASTDCYRQNIGYVGHKLGLSSGLTLFENYKLSFKSAFDADYFDWLMNQFNLRAQKDSPVSQLSAGQKRRAALVRLVLRQSKIWLLDEPFTALDSSSVTNLIHIFNAHLQEGGIIVLASHQPLSGLVTDHREYLL